MKTQFSIAILALVFSLAPYAVHAAGNSPKITQVIGKNTPDINQSSDDFKGRLDPEEFDGGALAGMGIVDGNAGFALVGHIAHKIIRNGFIPDLADSVSIEAQFGPIFGLGQTTLHYGAHLRWDFQQNQTWSFYALGGVGGNYSNYATGGRTEFFPRLGLGAYLKIFQNFDARVEISHELVALGATFPF